MVLALNTHVVHRMEVEEEKLLGEGGANQEMGHGKVAPGLYLIEEERENSVDKDSEGDVSVLEIVEMVGGDGAVGGEGLVLGGANE